MNEETIDPATYDAGPLLADIAKKYGPVLGRTPRQGGGCVACGKLHEPKQPPVRGYASGEELDLCNGCAAHVNTEEAISKAIAEGHPVHANVIYLRATKSLEEVVHE